MDAAIKATLPVNAHGRPVLPAFQHEGRTAGFAAYLSCFVVTTEATTFHGQWTSESEARRFAASVGRATAEASAPYYYVPGFGRVA